MEKTLVTWKFWRDQDQLKRPKPPHYELTDRYCCPCVACESWRGARVTPGRLCRPATRDPSVTRPGTVPAWEPGTWKKTGWDFRMEEKGVDHVLVIGYVPEDDIDNGGHLDCVVFMVQGEHPRLMVTSRKWLVALA